MATARAELRIAADADAVWKVVGDFETGPLKMPPGHVIECRTDWDIRTVVFADGTVARERLVAIEDSQRRIAYAVLGGTVKPEHDNASMQVVPLGYRSCRLIWIHDVLPNDLAKALAAAMREGGPMIKATFETV